MMWERVCKRKECGKTFFTTANNAQYCKDCRPDMNRQRNREAQRKNRSYREQIKREEEQKAQKKALEWSTTVESIVRDNPSDYGKRQKEKTIGQLRNIGFWGKANKGA